MSVKSELNLKKKVELIDIIIRKDDVEKKLRKENESLYAQLDAEKSHAADIKNDLLKTEQKVGEANDKYNKAIKSYNEKNEENQKLTNKINKLTEYTDKYESLKKTNTNQAILICILFVVAIVGFIL